MGTSPRTEAFLQIKEQLRLHPEWSDDQLIVRLGLKEAERDIIAVARRDLEAG